MKTDPSQGGLPLLWDIVCEVIDNFGDIGFCWRLACDLAARGERVRLWVDDAATLAWMAPGGHPSVELRSWPRDRAELAGLEAGAVLVETFGCSAPEALLAHFFEAKNDDAASAFAGFHRWINLEHLSAEAFVARSHQLPSPVFHGPGAGHMRHFFYPGFTPSTGGLLRASDLAQRQQQFQRSDWLATQHIPFAGERLIALFCYEPTALPALLDWLAQDAPSTRLLVTAGRSVATVQALSHSTTKRGSLQISYLPRLSQSDFDHLLWAADLNFVRGEDSLVRALWARRPFIWQAYPQHDGAHHAKLEALIETLQIPASLARWQRLWNNDEAPTELPPIALKEWQPAVELACTRLLAQPDLTTQLQRFVHGKS